MGSLRGWKTKFSKVSTGNLQRTQLFFQGRHWEMENKALRLACLLPKRSAIFSGQAWEDENKILKCACVCASARLRKTKTEFSNLSLHMHECVCVHVRERERESAVFESWLNFAPHSVKSHFGPLKSWINDWKLKGKNWIENVKQFFMRSWKCLFFSKQKVHWPLI